MPVVKSHEIHTRDDFAMLCNWRMLYTGAIEVGVDRGEFSRVFMARWYGEPYIGVDNYFPYGEMPGAREGDFQMACIRFAEHSGRARIVKVGSEFAPRSLSWNYGRKYDFVYIDASHEELDVWNDMCAWWEVTSDHGIFAGHDYDDTHPGVIASVNRFVEERNLMAYLTHEEGMASWYIYKGGIPGPDWRRLKV